MVKADSDTSYLIIATVVLIPGTQQPSPRTCGALDTLINNANENIVGTCVRDNTLCTEINCEHPDMITNLTFFPCNGTVSIHYLVKLRGSGAIVINVITSKDYSGRLNGVPGTLSLSLTQLDSGIAFGVSWMEVTAFYSTMFIVTHRQKLWVTVLIHCKYFKTQVLHLNVVSKIHT